MKIPIRTDPDFKPYMKRTLDLRPFFDTPDMKKQGEDVDEEQTFDINEPIIGEWDEPELPSFQETIVSSAIRSEIRRDRMFKMEKDERNRNKPIKRVFLEGLLGISESVVIFLIKRLQDFNAYLNPFETKHTEKQLYYLALSLPNTADTADKILLYYPLLGRSQRYKLLKIRRDTLNMYRKIYEKK